MSRSRRILILAEGKFAPLESKTANQVIRYLPEQVIGVIDSRHAGATAQQVLGFGGNIPVLADIESGLQFQPDTLLIGIAPTGGRLPETWRDIVCRAVSSGLNIISGLHTFLDEDEEIAALARHYDVRIMELRRVLPEYEVVAQGTWRTRKARTVLTVGTDCNAGKMTASLELHREFLRRGIRSGFVATGQTGILLSGRGVAVDAIVGDYISGAIEHELNMRDAEGHDYLHIEGQGAILHQGYSSVTIGLLHGVMPDAMIIVHNPGRQRDAYGCSIDDVNRFIRLYEAAVAPFKESRVVGIAVNTATMAQDDVDAAIAALEESTGLPAANVLTSQVSKLADAIISSKDVLI